MMQSRKKENPKSKINAGRKDDGTTAMRRRFQMDAKNIQPGKKGRKWEKSGRQGHRVEGFHATSQIRRQNVHGGEQTVLLT
jgi:hypothetical protein